MYNEEKEKKKSNEWLFGENPYEKCKLGHKDLKGEQQLPLVCQMLEALPGPYHGAACC